MPSPQRLSWIWPFAIMLTRFTEKIEGHAVRLPPMIGGTPMTGRSSRTGRYFQNGNEWALISDITEAVCKRGLLPGSPESNANKVRIATIRLVKEGILEREAPQDHPGTPTATACTLGCWSVTVGTTNVSRRPKMQRSGSPSPRAVTGEEASTGKGSSPGSRTSRKPAWEWLPGPGASSFAGSPLGGGPDGLDSR